MLLDIIFSYRDEVDSTAIYMHNNCPCWLMHYFHAAGMRWTKQYLGFDGAVEVTGSVPASLDDDTPGSMDFCVYEPVDYSKLSI